VCLSVFECKFFIVLYCIVLYCIDDAVEPFVTRIECLRGVAAQVEAERNTLLVNVNVLEQNIKDRSQQVIQAAELQTTDVLQELQSLKSAAEAEVQRQADATQFALTEMDSFRTRSFDLKSKGLSVDITQAVNNVRTRANELLRTHVIPSEYHAPKYKFVPANSDQLIGFSQNLIGRLVKDRESADSGKLTFYGNFCICRLTTIN